MDFLVLCLVAIGAIGVMPVYKLWRARLRGTACGLGAGLAVGLVASLVGLLMGLAEGPNNDLGHPRRVHVRNEAATVIYLVRLHESGTTVRLDPVQPGELAIIRGENHPAHRDLACADEPMALATVRSGSESTDGGGRLTAGRADTTIVAELDTCYPKGRNIVVWDGRTAFVDPDARPPLIDPEYEVFAYGWLTALALLITGVAYDVGWRIRLRRCRLANGPSPSPDDVVSEPTVGAPHE